jgi:hypothetical protein
MLQHILIIPYNTCLRTQSVKDSGFLGPLILLAVIFISVGIWREEHNKNINTTEALHSEVMAICIYYYICIKLVLWRFYGM